MQNDVTTIKVRRVIKAGDYYLMSLPTDHIHKTGLGKGDEIIVSCDNSLLMVMPCPSKLKEIMNEPKGVVNENDAKSNKEVKNAKLEALAG